MSPAEQAYCTLFPSAVSVSILEII